MMLFWLSLLPVSAQSFDDAFKDEAPSEKGEDPQSKDLQLILQLEACKETPETKECQEFFIQNGEDLGLDLDKYIITQPNVQQSIPTHQNNTSNLNLEEIDTMESSEEDYESYQPIPSSNKDKKVAFHLSTGISSGAFHGEYYGRIVKSNVDLSVIDLYAWQTLQSGSTLKTSLGISYAMSNRIRVGVNYQIRSGGEQTMNVHSFVLGQFSSVPPSQNLMMHSSSSWVLFGRWTHRITDKINGIGQVDIERLTIGYPDLISEEPYPHFSDVKEILLTASPKLSIKSFGTVTLEPGLELGYMVGKNGGIHTQQMNGGILSVNLSDDDVAKVVPPEPFSKWVYGFNVGVTF